MQKILFLFMPGAYIDVPPLGPALMQAVATNNGFESEFIDLNLELYITSKEKQSLKRIIDIDFYKLPYSDIKNYILLCRKWINRINDINPTWVGISVFTHKSHIHTTLFLKCLKKYQKNFKIVAGGAGVTVPSQQHPELPSYGKELLNSNLIDYYITGEGEAALTSLLTGNAQFPGINSEQFESLKDFNSVPTPNFDGFLLDRYVSYDSNNKLTLSVEGSRGCVRNCTFCDIKNIWKKYKFKDGKKLAQELIALQTRYNINNFWFNDSLINGSSLAYRNFISILAEHNAQVSDDQKIRWSSQYILKTKSTITENDIRLTKLAGGHTLAIGIESGSYKVRKHMGKNFTDEDIEHSFNLMRKYDIKIFLLMLIGYPTETQEDFQATLDFFKKYRNFALEGTITGVALGPTLDILPNTPLDDIKNKLDINLDPTKRIFWANQHSDLPTRIRRRMQAEEYVNQLGYIFHNNIEELKVFKNLLIHYER